MKKLTKLKYGNEIKNEIESKALALAKKQEKVKKNRK